MTRSHAIKEYLNSLDEFLEQQGFCRRRNAQEWKHKSDKNNELWLHFNFGLGIVNPSFGVNYLDLQLVLPKSVAPVTSTMKMLTSVLPVRQTYIIDEGTSLVKNDLLKWGLPYLSRLKDRAFVIEQLLSPTVREWPTISYSDRIRLLPLLLAIEGRIKEACDQLDIFRVESLGRDQLIPAYATFANAFAEKFVC